MKNRLPKWYSESKNNKPTFRRGTTAISHILDYNVKRKFMIDVACFQG
ncbi:hypothetical protein [Clostridium perfringens]|nr:hypothetical protein [Clostridium perfringens]MDK0855322.1 hypothetical protein [Clostridium perfringens]